MATSSSSISLKTPTNSGSVTSCKPISDLLQALVSAGVLTQSTDTGQVAWGSVTATQVSTALYEIYKLNDSLNGTYPLFIKFVYQLNSTAATPTFTVQIGTGSDGAGNLTGASTAVIYRGLTGQADAVNSAVYASAGDGYLNLFGGFQSVNATASPGGFALSIERTRNTDGTINGSGVSVVGAFMATSSSGLTTYLPGASSQTGPGYAPFVAFSGAAARASLANLFTDAANNWPPVANRGSSYRFNPMFDGTNYLAAAIQPYAGRLFTANTALLLVDSTFPAYSTVSLSVYSVAHTYQSLSQNALAPVPGLTTPVGSASTSPSYSSLSVMPVFRYE